MKKKKTMSEDEMLEKIIREGMHGESGSEKQRASTRTSKTSTSNREFAVITYLFLALFISLMVYMVYFQVAKSEEFINSPYNARQEEFTRRVIRGEIRSADGLVLAKTQIDENGKETRTYPYANLYAHVVGFSTHGKSGLESAMNFNLLRSHTFLPEQIINELTGEKNMGDSVVTTLSSAVQEAAYTALGGYNGAVVVLEPATGRILAMVSKPDYNPNTVASDWEAMTAEETGGSMLLNRATQGQYPPGSTFKLVTTLAYVREDQSYNEFTYQCTGSMITDAATVHCYGNKAHGTESLKDAFANSCNSAYASIGLNLDTAKFTKLCSTLLFGQTLPGELGAGKSSFTLGTDASPGLKMQTAIGQGATLVTPYHMALLAAAVANDGVLMKPYLVDHTENEEGTVVEAYEPEKYKTLLSTEEASLLQEYMEYVVTNGTGSKLAGQSYTAAGKTGSAEFSDSRSESHSWFIGYAHRDDKPDIALAVIAEGAGTGSEVAVPAAKAIFDAYYQ